MARLLLAVVAPLLFFGVLEMGLRVGGFGRSTDFFIPATEPGVFRTNPRFTELFLPASFGLKPVNFQLPRAKPANSFRVFVLGESAAMGVPEPAFGLAPQLQAQLRATLPEKRVEVFNLGVTAINSHAVRLIAREALAFSPDVLVIYMGNNEVVGPYGPSSVVTGGVLPRWVIRIGVAASRTRTGQLLQHVAAILRPARFSDWRGMEMFAGKAVAADDPRLADVYANFAGNLAEILALARREGVRVILSTVATNVRDCAPFLSRHAPQLGPEERAAWSQARQQAELAETLGQSGEARFQWERAAAIEPGHADTQFRLARALHAAGEIDAARRHFLAAQEQDTLRFRADAQINACIRRAAGGDGVTLVDAARELGSDLSSAGAPAGAEYFFEHVHLRWEGNHALARLLAPGVLAALSPGQVASARQWLEPEACARALGYTELGRLAMLRDMDVLTQRPPFTGQSTYGVDRTRLHAQMTAIAARLAAPEATALAVQQSDEALRRDPENPDLLFQAAAVRLQARDFSRALALSERAAAHMPPSPELAAQRAFLLAQLGRLAEAEQVLLASAGADPFYFQTYGLLASVWLSTGRRTAATEYFKRLTERMPESRSVRVAYAGLLAQAGDRHAAAIQWRTVLAMVPDDEAALAPLLEQLEAERRREEALQLMLKAFAYNPRNFENNARLAQVFEEKNDPAALVTYLQALAASGPVNARLHLDLSRSLGALGRHQEADAARHTARRLAEEQADTAVLDELRSTE